MNFSKKQDINYVECVTVPRSVYGALVFLKKVFCKEALLCPQTTQISNEDVQCFLYINLYKWMTVYKLKSDYSHLLVRWNIPGARHSSTEISNLWRLACLLHRYEKRSGYPIKKQIVEMSNLTVECAYFVRGRVVAQGLIWVVHFWESILEKYVDCFLANFLRNSIKQEKHIIES